MVSSIRLQNSLIFMKIELIVVGKTDFDFIKQGIELYEKRIKRFVPFTIHVISGNKKSKNLSEQEIKKRESEVLLNYITREDMVILLDENGKEYTSVKFAGFLKHKMVNSIKRIQFIIGGAYGFSENLYNIADYKISISQMTFSHQVIRLIFMEQLYRAYTIINGTPYHHR